MNQVQLWSTKTGQQIVCFYHADKPAFTLDCRYLLYIDSGQTLMTYCLHRMAPVRYLACKADELCVLPVTHGLVLVTTTEQSLCTDVSLWDFDEGRQLARLSGVATGGLRDVSKDGRVAVDANLQVFSLETGALKLRVGDNVGDLTFVRLTYDGRYVVWVDKLSIKVARVCDGAVIADTYTHERVTSLCVLDYGYVLVVGREDGRIIMMKVLPDCVDSHRPRTAQERCSLLHSRQMCPDDVIASFDSLYQCAAHSVKDSELLRPPDSIRHVLALRAKAPLLSTAMWKAADDKYRRSYSQLHDSGTLTGASSYHDIAGSSSTYDIAGSSSCLSDLSPVTADMAGASLIDRRSHSVTDVLALCTLSRHCPGIHGTASPTHSTNSPTYGTTSPTATAAASPPLRTPAHKFLGYIWEFGASIRSRRKKYRRRARAETNKRDRMPSV